MDYIRDDFSVFRFARYSLVAILFALELAAIEFIDRGKNNSTFLSDPFVIIKFTIVNAKYDT